jgi:hypothetical protein
MDPEDDTGDDPVGLPNVQGQYGVDVAELAFQLNFAALSETLDAETASGATDQKWIEPPPGPLTSTITCTQFAAGQVPSLGLGGWIANAASTYIRFTNWVVGTGNPVVAYPANSSRSQAMMQAYGLQQNVARFLAGGPSSGVQGFGLRGLWHSGVNPATQFVGSYAWSMTRSSSRLNITLSNTTTKWSAFYHVPIFDSRPPLRSGWEPMGRVDQYYHISLVCRR